MSLDKTQILDVKKENAVIACLLTDPALMYDCDLKITEFHNPIARDIFAVMDAIAKKNDKRNGSVLDFSPLQIDSAAKTLGLKIDIEHVRDLRSATGSDGYVNIQSFGSYVQDIKEIDLRVRLFDAAQDTEKLALDTKIDANTALARAENLVISIEDDINDANEPKQIEANGDEDYDECLGRAASGIDPGILTGFRRFDEATGGCRKGSLTVFAARAKTGKSLIGVNIAWNIFQKYGAEVPILYLDTEMPTWQVRRRLWGIASGVNPRSIEKGELTPYEQQCVEDARKKLKDMPLYHLYMPNFKPEGLVRLVRKWKNMKKIGLLMFDYIKLPEESSSKNTQEWQALGYLTNTLKNQIAGRLDIPVIAWAQLNRSGVAQAQSGEIDETSIGGSDRITQYCSTLAVFRKASEKEMCGVPESNSPEWKRYGKYANRYMHILVTRDGGDDADPIPMYLNGKDVKITESGDFIPHGSTSTLSETIGNQIAREATRSTASAEAEGV